MKDVWLKRKKFCAVHHSYYVFYYLIFNTTMKKRRLCSNFKVSTNGQYTEKLAPLVHQLILANKTSGYFSGKRTTKRSSL